MDRILVDADAFVALAKEDDANHKKAVEVLGALNERPVSFLTTNYVFLEVVTVLSVRVGRTAALAFIDSMRSVDSPFPVHRISEELDDSAVEIFTKQTSKNVSFVDCSNIAVCRALHVDSVFSFDKIYPKNGIPLVK